MAMFFEYSGDSFPGFPLSFWSRWRAFNREKRPINTQHQDAIESPVGIAGRGFRVVADEGNNFEPRLRANRIAIVLPSLHSLTCYAKHLSYLDVGQIPVNACQPEMFAKRLRMR